MITRLIHQGIDIFLVHNTWYVLWLYNSNIAVVTTVPPETVAILCYIFVTKSPAVNEVLKLLLLFFYVHQLTNDWLT